MGNYVATYPEYEGCCCPEFDGVDENGTATASQSWLIEFEPDEDWEADTSTHVYGNTIDSFGEWDTELYLTGDCEAVPGAHADDEDGYVHEVEYDGFCYDDQCSHGVLQCSSLGQGCYSKITNPFANDASMAGDVNMFAVLAATVAAVRFVLRLT